MPLMQVLVKFADPKFFSVFLFNFNVIWKGLTDEEGNSS